MLGKFRRDGEARATPAFLSRDGKLLLLLHREGTGEFLADAERRDIDLSPRIASIPRQVSLPGGWSFETEDNDGIDALLGRPHDRLVPALERFGPHLVVVAVISVMAIVGLVRFGLPAATDAAVNATPPAVEKAIAQGSLASLDRTLFKPSDHDPARRAAIEARFAQLVDAYRARSDARGEADFRLLFRDAPFVGPNAFAFPGGTIVITDDLLDLLPEDGPVLAVLSHEIAHVHHRHGLNSLYRSAGIGALILFLGGEASQLAEELVVQGAVLSNLAASRSMEAEADLTGVAIAVGAGIEPEGLVTALAALNADCPGCDDASWSSSHPSFAKRRNAIRDAIKRSGEVRSVTSER
ncbi:M48 family metallopeptidase [Parvularcula lutaonensis]|uniref:M48 family metallopeptidase n=1 Tax=Parvularcula lutaonensis TaxID=491923 RepID=A0ABV7MD10_9PROT|nr:M48 family metallopeptidase [Parvularcula lutaonensis]